MGNDAEAFGQSDEQAVGVDVLAQAVLTGLTAREGLGCLLTFAHLIDVGPDSGMVFLPLFPRLEIRLYLVWNRYQTFTPIAERFLNQIRADFAR